jgi:Acyl-CoA dehydrogenase, C-terminal domain
VDFDLSPDQSTVVSAVQQITEQHRDLPIAAQYYMYGDVLDRQLEEAGYYGDVLGFGLDRVDAALVLEQVALSPFAVPAMASLIVAPAVFKLPPARPIALVASTTPGPIRFVNQARTALIDSGDKVLMLDLSSAFIEPIDTIFAYPFGRLERSELARATPLVDVDARAFRSAWRLGLTYEILGAMKSAHELTIGYVKQRTQFKRPIGSFQAVQHRLSEDTTHIAAVSCLAARAGWSGRADDIALAAAHAQKTAWQVIYNCHQFHGAMGLTLEYVLHHWTYRLKVLAGELGGSSAQARAATEALWADRPVHLEAS